MNLERFVRKCVWPDLRCCHVICMQALRNTTGNVFVVTLHVVEVLNYYTNYCTYIKFIKFTH